MTVRFISDAGVVEESAEEIPAVGEAGGRVFVVGRAGVDVGD